MHRERGLSEDREEGEQCAGRRGAASAGVGSHEILAYGAHIAVIEGPLNAGPEPGRLPGREESCPVSYQQMEQCVIGGGDPAPEAGLFRSLTFTYHQVLGLLKQVVMKRQRVLLSSNLNVRPTVALTVNY